MKTIEGNKLFPYVAWTIVVLFVVFVFSITLELRRTSDELSTKVTILEDKINQNVMDVKFDTDSTTR